MNTHPEKPRYYALDALRGLSILVMIAYHFDYNLVMYDIVPPTALYNPVLNFIQPTFASFFIALSGASCTFSRSNVRRGIRILLCAMLVTLATYIFNPNAYIRFGILHFMGCAALIYELTRPMLRRLNRFGWLWLFPFFIAFFALDRTFNIEHLWALGIQSPSFRSTDYFPIMPWIFMYFFGVWLGGVISRGKLPAWFYKIRCPFLEKCGKHTLIIYLLHQPVLIGLTYLILWLH